MNLEFEELIAQPYRNCTFSAGFVTGHPIDTLYVRLSRDGEEPTTILLRPDEAAAIAWCLTGALWSERMRQDARHDPQRYIRDVPPISTIIHEGATAPTTTIDRESRLEMSDV